MGLAVALSGLLLTACASSLERADAGAAASRPLTSSGAAASVAPATDVAGSTESSPSPSSGPPAGPGQGPLATGAPETGPRESTPELTVVLGSACVQPGAQQTIHVSAHRPASITYNTHYADGRTGSDDGGIRIGTTDAAGEYRDGWTVSPRSALGPATVQVGVSRDGGVSTAPALGFTVAAHC